MKIDDLHIPDVGDDDVLIKVASCGVCHTDLKVVEGRNRFTPPTILGHEVAGNVEQIGAHCKDFKVGDRVIIGMRYKCGRCRYCLSARENLCERRPAPPTLKKTDGTVITCWNVGGFAEYVSVPSYMTFKIPDGISMEEASIVGCRVTTPVAAIEFANPRIADDRDADRTPRFGRGHLSQPSSQSRGGAGSSFRVADDDVKRAQMSAALERARPKRVAFPNEGRPAAWSVRRHSGYDDRRASADSGTEPAGLRPSPFTFEYASYAFTIC